MNFIKRYWADYAIAAFAVIVIACLTGCVTRREIEAAIWMNNGLDPTMCGPSKVDSEHPELWNYGFYRKLDDDVCRRTNRPKGCKEFMPFCNPEARNFFAMHERDFNRMLDATLPKEDE